MSSSSLPSELLTISSCSGVRIERERERDVTLSCFDRIPIAIFLFRVLRSCSVGVVLLEPEVKVYYSSTTIPAGVNQEYGRMIFTGTVFEEVHYIHVLYPWGLE